MTSTTRDKHDDPNPLPVPPGPPPKIETFMTAVKVFTITDCALALKHAWNAYAHFFDYAQLVKLDHWTAMVQVTFHGFLQGLIPGALLGAFVLLSAWAGPQLSAYLGPVIVAAAEKTMKIIRGFSLAFRGKPDNSNHDKDNTGSETNG